MFFFFQQSPDSFLQFLVLYAFVTDDALLYILQNSIVKTIDFTLCRAEKKLQIQYFHFYFTSPSAARNWVKIGGKNTYGELLVGEAQELFHSVCCYVHNALSDVRSSHHFQLKVSVKLCKCKFLASLFKTFMFTGRYTHF